MRRTGHHSQGKTAEAPAVPPFEPPGKYLEQRKEAPKHGGWCRLSESNG